MNSGLHLSYEWNDISQYRKMLGLRKVKVHYMLWLWAIHNGYTALKYSFLRCETFWFHCFLSQRKIWLSSKNAYIVFKSKVSWKVMGVHSEVPIPKCRESCKKTIFIPRNHLGNRKQFCFLFCSCLRNPLSSLLKCQKITISSIEHTRILQYSEVILPSMQLSQF